MVTEMLCDRWTDRQTEWTDAKSEIKRCGCPT